MEKTLEIKISGLKCDAPGCDYQQDEPRSTNYEVWKTWLNVPCPKCGASLLTEADLKTMRHLLKFTKTINGLLWPLTLLPRGRKKARLRLNMDGTGKVNPGKIEEINEEE